MRYCTKNSLEGWELVICGSSNGGRGILEEFEKVLNCLLIREWHGVDPCVMLQMEPLIPWLEPTLIIFADAWYCVLRTDTHWTGPMNSSAGEIKAHINSVAWDPLLLCSQASAVKLQKCLGQCNAKMILAVRNPSSSKGHWCLSKHEAWRKQGS